MKAFLVGILILLCLGAYPQINEQQSLDKITDLFREQSTDYQSFKDLCVVGEDDFSFVTKVDEALQEHFYPFGEIVVDNLYGNYYRNSNQYDKALEEHGKALELARKYNFTDAEIYTLNMMGVVYRRQDMVSQGLKYHHDALNLIERMDSPNTFTRVNMGIALNGIGNAYLILDEHEAARKQFIRSLELEEVNQNKLGLAINYQNIGHTYEAEDSLDIAMEYYNKSLENNRAIKSELGQIICLNSIANIYLKQHNYSKALPLLNTAERMVLKLGDNYYAPNVYLNKGKALLSKKEYDKAEHYLQNSIDLAKDKKLKSLASEGYKTLSLLEDERSNYKKALFYERQYQQYSDTILNEKNLKFKNDLEAKYNSVKQTEKINTLQEEKENYKIKLDRKNLYFYSAIGIFAILITMGIFYNRNLRLQKENEMLELEQKALRAQMNPHFIFNALNSIKHFIINQEPKEAASYLGKFSKLIRGILSLSDSNEISLKEELDTMKSYLTIENLRFDNHIDFKLKIDPTLHPDDFIIPPLLLQPFLENCIWHGLAQKQGDKEIVVEVNPYDEEHFEIKIIDNGIGINAAQKWQAEKVSMDKKSMGLDLTTKRIKNFYQCGNHRKCSVSITDLSDEGFGKTGTKVTLILPIKY